MSAVENPIRNERSKPLTCETAAATPPPTPHAAASSEVYEELGRLAEFMPERFREVFCFRWGLRGQFPHLASEVVHRFELPRPTVDAMLSRCLWNVARHAHLQELPALRAVLGEDRGRWTERAWAHADRRWGNPDAAFSEAVLLLSVAGLVVPEAKGVAHQHMVDIGLEQENRWVSCLSECEQVEASRQAVDRMVSQVIWPPSSSKLPSLGGFSVRRPLPAWTQSKSGVFESRKLDRLVQFDSELELVILRQLEADPRVEEYQEQPATIPYVVDGEPHQYTPDVMVRLADGRAFIIEAKPPAGLCDFTNWMKWASLARWCEQAGIGFWIGSPQRSIIEHRYQQPDPELRQFVADKVQTGPVTGRDYTALKSLVGAEQLGYITTAELLDCRVLPGRLRQAEDPDRGEAQQLWALIDQHLGAQLPDSPLAGPDIS